METLFGIAALLVLGVGLLALMFAFVMACDKV
jgi:hypothetical protein